MALDHGTTKIIMLSYWNDRAGVMERGQTYTVSNDLARYLEHNKLAVPLSVFAREALRELGATGIVIKRSASPELVNRAVKGMAVYQDKDVSKSSKVKVA